MTATTMTVPGSAFSKGPYAAAPRRTAPVAATPSHSVGRIRVIDTPVMRRRRRTVLAVILAVVAAVFGPQAFAGDDSSATMIYDTHTVAHGETLWSIAASITPEGEDVRDAVAEISQMNAMSGSTLQVGEQLRLPVVDSSGR